MIIVIMMMMFVLARWSRREGALHMRVSVQAHESRNALAMNALARCERLPQTRKSSCCCLVAFSGSHARVVASRACEIKRPLESSEREECRPTRLSSSGGPVRALFKLSRVCAPCAQVHLFAPLGVR